MFGFRLFFFSRRLFALWHKLSLAVLSIFLNYNGFVILWWVFFLIIWIFVNIVLLDWSWGWCLFLSRGLCVLFFLSLSWLFFSFNLLFLIFNFLLLFSMLFWFSMLFLLFRIVFSSFDSLNLFWSFLLSWCSFLFFIVFLSLTFFSFFFS